MITVGLSGRDKAEVSDSAYQVAKFYSILSSVPDIRVDLVDKFKKDIRAGAYEVPIEALVNTLVSKIPLDN